jgi:hypothetical protein
VSTVEAVLEDTKTDLAYGFRHGLLFGQLCTQLIRLLNHGRMDQLIVALAHQGLAQSEG